MNYILRRKSKSARLLARYLNIPCRRQPHQNSTVVIRYGNAMPVRCEREINKRSSVLSCSDKYGTLERLSSAGIRVPKHSRNYQDFSPAEFPLYGRQAYHTGGLDIIFCMTEREASIASRYVHHWTQYIPWEAEYRFHVLGTHVVVQVKEPPRDKAVKNFFIRNHKWGWRFRRISTFPAYIREYVPVALHIREMLQLDFCAIDVVYSTDENMYVLEVNTAPGIVRDDGTPGAVFEDYVNFLRGLLP